MQETDIAPIPVSDIENGQPEPETAHEVTTASLGAERDSYFFPAFGYSVEASSLDEAKTKLKEHVESTSVKNNHA